MKHYIWTASHSQKIKEVDFTIQKGIFRIKQLESGNYLVKTSFSSHDKYMGFPEPEELQSLLKLLEKHKIPFIIDPNAAYVRGTRDCTFIDSIELPTTSWDLVEKFLLV